MDLDRVAAELYGLRPDRFTSIRDQRAKQATAGGDRDLAAAIRNLRKPTLSAWAVNVMARERADRIDALLELGERLRNAQRGLRGEELRALSQRRGELVSELVRDGRRLAADAGQRLSDAAGDEVRATLEAALADEEAGDAVRSGRLVKPLSYSGFGGDLAGAASTGMAPAPRKPAGRRHGGAARAVSREERREADRRVEAELRREQAERDARRAQEEARARLDEAQERVAALRRELDEARRAAANADDELRRATQRYERARRDTENARRGRY